MKWTVEITIDDYWVENGFDLNDERITEDLSRVWDWMAPHSELIGRVVASPDPKEIRKLQGFND